MKQPPLPPPPPPPLTVLEFICHCTAPDLPPTQPRTKRVKVYEIDVLSGALLKVQACVYEQLWGEQQDKHIVRGGLGGQPLPMPLFLYTLDCDMPLTAETLRARLLGGPPFGLPQPKELIAGPTWTQLKQACGVSPEFLRHGLNDPHEAVGRLYVCEAIDNSLESLRTRKDRTRSQELHVYFAPQGCGTDQPFVCTWDNGKGLHSMDDLTKSFTYAFNPHAGIKPPICNDASEFGWVNGRLSRFGVGHQKAAFQRGSTLTVISRGEGSDIVVEGTKDLDESIQLYYDGEEAESWEPKKKSRSVIAGDSHELTSASRGQAWEYKEQLMQSIVQQASQQESYFIEIVSKLNDRTLTHISTPSSEDIYRELAHMYFFYTSLPSHSSSPFNLGYTYGPVEMHLHVAKIRRAGQSTSFEDFRLDQEPWFGWPDVQNDEKLRLECVPARLLRLVKANSTFEPPLSLPSRRTVSDCFCFGFTHASMQQRSEDSPIHLVKLHYLPNDGCNDLKKQLGLEGFGPVKYSTTRLADVYFQGRLVPFAVPIEEMGVLTEAVKKVQRSKNATTAKAKVHDIVQSRIFGQVFLQGAGEGSLVDDTKFHLGNLNTSSLLSTVKESTDAASDKMSYFSVEIRDGRQFFQKFRGDRTNLPSQLIDDLCFWVKSCQEKFEREYVVDQELSVEQAHEGILPKCRREGKLFARLTAGTSSGQGDSRTSLERGARLQTNIGTPSLYPGARRDRTPVEVLAVRVKEGAGSIGSRTTILVRLLPEVCFGEKVWEYSIDDFLKDKREQADPTPYERSLESLSRMNLQVKVPGCSWTKAEPIKLNCCNQAHPVELMAFLPNNNVRPMTQWLHPDFQCYDKGNPPANASKATRQTYPLFRLVQKIYVCSTGDVVQSEQPHPRGDTFHLEIPAAVLRQPQELRAVYELWLCNKLFSSTQRFITVRAGPPASLSADPEPAACQLGADFRLAVKFLDLCHNWVPLPCADIQFLIEPLPGLEVQVLSKGLEADRTQLCAQARLFSSGDFLAQQFGRGPDVQGVVQRFRMHLSCGAGPSITGQLSLSIKADHPARLVPAPGMNEDVFQAENGRQISLISLVAEDEWGCAVSLDEQGHWQGRFQIIGPQSWSKSGTCSIQGCRLTTPAVLVDVGALSMQDELQLEVQLARANQVITTFRRSFPLLPSHKPHLIVLKLGDSPNLEQLDDEQFGAWSSRANSDMRSAANQAHAQRAITSPAFLLKYPNSQGRERPVDQLTLSLWSDTGPWDDDNQVTLHVWPANRRKFTVDNNRVSGFHAPALEEPAHFYWVTCSRPNVADVCAFFLIVAAVEPPPAAWQCRSAASESAVGAAGSRRNTRQNPAPVILRETRAKTGQPLCVLLHVCCVTADGTEVRSHSFGAPSVRLDQASPEVQLSSSDASQHSDPLDVTQWRTGLCLIGRAGVQCDLLFEGGGLQLARLTVTLEPGCPTDFSLHGLPGCLEATPLIEGTSQSIWSTHQGLQGLCIVLRDACGNATPVSQPGLIRFVQENEAGIHFTPDNSLQLEPARAAHGIESLVLARPDECRAHSRSQEANSMITLSAEVFVGQAWSKTQQLPVIVQARGEFVATIVVQTGDSLAAGAHLEQPLARVQLFDELGQQVTAQELQQICRGLRAVFDGGGDLSFRASQDELHVLLERAPISAGRYTLHVHYEEQREAKASALLGCATLRTQPAYVTVRGGEPAELRVASQQPRDDLTVGSHGSHLLEELRLQLVDRYVNNTTPRDQSSSITLTVSGDSSIMELPILAESSVQVGSQGQACFRRVHFQQNPCLSDGHDSAALELLVVCGSLDPLRIPFIYYDSDLKSQQEVRDIQTAQKQTQQLEIEVKLQGVADELAQVLRCIQGAINGARLGSIPRVVDVDRAAQLAASSQQATLAVCQAVDQLQHEGCSEAQGSADTATIRQVLEDFSLRPVASATQHTVLGLVLDLLKCKAPPQSALHRILSWHLRPAMHVVVVLNLQTQDELSTFAASRDTELDIRVLDWLNPYQAPPKLRAQKRFPSTSSSYQLPVYLEDTCEVAATVPPDYQRPLLASLTGRTVILGTFEMAKEYRVNEIAHGKACPALVSLGGHCITEAGDILSAACPAQAVLPMLGTTSEPAVSSLYKKLQQESGKLQALCDQHGALSAARSRLWSPAPADEAVTRTGEGSRATAVRLDFEQAGSSTAGSGYSQEAGPPKRRRLNQ